jgi:hypothetical protein
MAGIDQVVKLPDIRHLDGCPAERIEAFRHDSPRRRTTEDGEEILAYTAMSVVRCGDCGEQLVRKDQGKLVNDYRRSLKNANQN